MFLEKKTFGKNIKQRTLLNKFLSKAVARRQYSKSITSYHLCSNTVTGY